MARLVYSALTSLDGYVADEDGNFDWAVPDDEVHAFVNDLQRSIGIHPLSEAVQAQKDILRDFFCLASAEEVCRQCVHHASIAVIEQSESRHIALRNTPGQCLVARFGRDRLIGH